MGPEWRTESHLWGLPESQDPTAKLQEIQRTDGVYIEGAPRFSNSWHNLQNPQCGELDSIKDLFFFNRSIAQREKKEEGEATDQKRLVWWINQMQHMDLEFLIQTSQLLKKKAIGKF